MPVAYNPDTNEAMVLDPETGWIPTKLAVNPDTGDRMAFDGSAWVPIKAKPTPNPAAAAENQWRQGNKMPPIGQPPERKLAETPGGLLVSTAIQAKEKWDNFKAPDLSLLGSPSNERDDPNRGPAFEESLKLLPFAMPGGPPILRTPAGRVSATPRGYSSPGPNPTVPPAPPGGINFRTNETPVAAEPTGSPSPTPPPPVSGQAMTWDGKAWVPASQAMGAPGPIPPLPVEPVVRPKTGARLLPPETSHSLPPEAPEIRAGRASVGAAASGHGPLSDLSPGAENLLRKAVGQEGLSPYMVEQRISEMSPHQFLAEVSPNMQSHASGLHASGGAARNEIELPFVGRKAETPQRMKMLFDEAFGAARNGVQYMRSLKEAQTAQSSKAWRDFQQTPIPPFPGMAQLMDRLDAAGALRHATKAQREWGRPVNSQFKPGAASSDPLQPSTEVPTAGTFQFAKEHLDGLIEDALSKPGHAGAVARYSAMKNDLVNAIVNHPDSNVAGKWRAALDLWAGPAQLMNAYKVGERVLTGHIHRHELPVITESYGPREMDALITGMRGHLENNLGRPGNQELPAIKMILGKNNQEKIAHAIGEPKAENLFTAIGHEHGMHFSHDQTIKNSMTEARRTAKEFWAPPESTFPGGIPTSLRGAGRMAIDATLSHVAGKRNAQQAAQFEKIREEVARIMTLQGAERDAALHYLTMPKPSMRVVGSP